jgi:hypothetical protein
VTALLWAAVYGAGVVMEAAFDAAGDVLEAWDDQGVARNPPSTSHAAPLT